MNESAQPINWTDEFADGLIRGITEAFAKGMFPDAFKDEDETSGSGADSHKSNRRR